jgi:hypothetical protein
MKKIRSTCAATAFALLVSVFAAGAGAASSAPRPSVSDIGMQPKTFMFVGNSFMYYNNSMHSHFLDIIRGSDKSASGLRATSITMSGSGINWHDVDSYFKPGGVASYSFTPDNKVVFNKFDKPFDVVIIQDCSQCPVHPQMKSVFHEYAKKQSEVIRKHGAVPVFLMTWAYEDEPSMTRGLADEYTTAGNANNALVVPAGLAFASSRSKQPSLSLYQKDKRHPTLAGTYLAAATIYSALYRKPAAGSGPGELGSDTVKFLQSVAWETVQDYYRK